MKLLSMTDFVLEQWKSPIHRIDVAFNCIRYAQFLKQPLKLEMFTACDSNKNQLNKPTHFDEWYYEYKRGFVHEYEIPIMREYLEAIKKVMFSDFEIHTLLDNETKRLTSPNGKFNVAWYNKGKGWYLSNGVREGMIVEDLIKYDLELTDSAIQIIEFNQ